MTRRPELTRAVLNARARWQQRQEALRPPAVVLPRAARTLSVANTSGYKGVSAYRGKWQAAICVGRVRHHIGVFDCPEAAARAYDAKAVELLGDRAVTNARLGRLPTEEAA